MRKTKLVLIEDDIDLIEIVTAFFKQKDIEVTVFTDAEDALQKFDKQQIDSDLVLSDLNLPTISGMEFVKRIKLSHPHLPVILMTAEKSIDTAVLAIESGAYDFVLKPLNLLQLLITVRRALHFNQLQSENITLKTVVDIRNGMIEGLIAKSVGMKNILELCRRVAKSQASIFISGESGTGKEVIAKTIHQLSSRNEKPFVAINCSAIPENLLESELFGYVKGAFTGANEKKMGLFEEADGGTLFLDEIGDLSLPLQAKLLRVIQERKIKRLGENTLRAIDIRIICATHKDLRTELKTGQFREDLFFRLNVVPIRIPPLRERTEDIIPLAHFFLKKFSILNKLSFKGFSKDSIEYLVKNIWKGNVRELENAIERAVVLSTHQVEIQIEDLLQMDPELSNSFSSQSVESNEFCFPEDSHPLTLDELGKRYIEHILVRNNGAKEATAKILGIDRKTLYRKLNQVELN